MNPYGNIASGLNPTTSGITESSLNGLLSDTEQSVLNSNHNSDSILASLYGNDSPEQALAWLKNNNPELYYQLLIERDNNRLEWERYKEYQKDYYSTQKESLLKAGLNPWLALQNFGSIGTGSVSNSIGSLANGSSTLKAQREAKESDLLKGIGVAGVGLIGAIIGLLMMAL